MTGIRPDDCLNRRDRMGDDIERTAAFTYAKKFGQIAVSMGFINDDQVQAALREQLLLDASTRLRPKKLIGEILFENGRMTIGKIESVLNRLTG